MTTIQDDRTEEQQSSHYWGVIAKDKAMSYWGSATGGVSRVAWACQSHADASKVFDWVESRPEMKNVHITDLRKYSPSKGDAHLHIYLVKETHPAFDQ